MREPKSFSTGRRPPSRESSFLDGVDGKKVTGRGEANDDNGVVSGREGFSMLGDEGAGIFFVEIFFFFFGDLAAVVVVRLVRVAPPRGPGLVVFMIFKRSKSGPARSLYFSPTNCPYSSYAAWRHLRQKGSRKL